MPADLTFPRCDLPAERGEFYWGDSLDVMRGFPDGCADLIIFSPPFDGPAGVSSTEADSRAFLEWFTPFFGQFRRILRPTGCVVFELGGVWLPDAPGKSTQHAAAVHSLSSAGWKLVQDFYWYNPQLIYPEPYGAARAKDSVTPIWIMSGSYDVPFDVAALERSPHAAFVRGNLLEFGSSGSADQAYENRVGRARLEPYIDRWPVAVPGLFIDLLTEPGGFVLDPFAGTGATCLAAERMHRRWAGIERNQELEPHVQAMFSAGHGG